MSATAHVEDRSPLLSLIDCRFVMVMGKGGAGKSTLAAALARVAAGRGRQVLCLDMASEPDEPSPLSRALGGGPLGREPAPLGPDVPPSIRALRVHADDGFRAFVERVVPVRSLAAQLLDWPPVADFLAGASSVEAMGKVYRSFRLVEGLGEEGLCLQDLSATGSAAAISRLPELLLKLMPFGPVASAIRKGRELVTDGALARWVLVTTPDVFSAREAVLLGTLLHDAGCPNGVVAVNRWPSPGEGLDGERAEAEAALDLLSKWGGAAVTSLPHVPSAPPDRVARRLAALLEEAR